MTLPSALDTNLRACVCARARARVCVSVRACVRAECFGVRKAI